MPLRGTEGCQAKDAGQCVSCRPSLSLPLACLLACLLAAPMGLYTSTNKKTTQTSRATELRGAGKVDLDVHGVPCTAQSPNPSAHITVRSCHSNALPISPS